jgi:hypothetical protein
MSVYSKMGRCGEGFCIRRKDNAALRASEMPFLRTFFSKDPESSETKLILKQYVTKTENNYQKGTFLLS